jgi:CRISPR-associated endoribonuclease Cas6
MPTTAIIVMRALNSGKIRRSFRCLMYPILLDRISSIAPSLSAEIHNTLLMNAFSLSPVMGVRGSDIVENQEVWVRVGLLSNRVEDAFFDTLEKGLWSKPVQLENFHFAVESVTVGKQDGTIWSGRESYEEILRRSAPENRFGLKIETPMAFKRGDLHYPLPDPALIFGNLLRRWNLFSPVKLPENIMCDGVSCARFNLNTEPYALRKGATILGCRGKLVFLFKGNPDEIILFNALLNYSFYAGIGVKTSQGMGMCRIL